ncbi:MAG: signal recognition particle protein [Prevotella sp.]|jgi:signal recognition particle subunit SRP54|nr:signal recognition particle protein [Prevotella sp.]MCR5070222.1 signal recognition particle protein [Prevotella sp.]
MFDNLSDRLERSFKILKGEGKITEINVAETLKDIRRALLDADVNYKVAKTFTDTVKQKALGMNVLTAVKPGQLMVKLVHDELALLMGGEATDMQLSGHPAVIMMAGLNGAGKTTMSGKLAKLLKDKRNKKPLLAACDTFRPAAMEQLRVLAEQIDVPIYMEQGATDPVAVAKNAIQEAKAKAYDVVIIDTAGRQSIDEELMKQAENIKAAVTPNETLLVVDAMTGQDAVNTAKTFNERLEIDGVILTKLDGDTRGGAALSIRTVVDKPIKFIGTGEKMEALDVFHPERMADRILGMGDVVSLVERAQEQFDLEEAKRLQKKIAKNKFDFNDFLGQIQQIKKMGNIKDLASMIPGVGKAIKDVDIDDDAFKGIEAIIYSMTPKERTNPEILNQSRKMRIAKGSGTNIQEVNRLIKQFDQMRKMMKMISGNNMGNMMKMAGMMGKMKGMPGMPKF